MSKNTARYTFTITVNYNPKITNEESVGAAVDNLLETALDTPGILDEYGNPDVSQTDGGLQHMLEHAFAADAYYLLREVYKHFGLKIPAWLM